MPAKALRILSVGPPSASTTALLEHLQFRGWGSFAVETLAEAKSVLRTIRFSIVLAAEQLRDGKGYDLSPDVAERDGSLLVCVALSESCLWLPVVIDGERTLGQLAINEHLLEHELAMLLSGSAKRTAANDQAAIAQAAGKHEIPPRRRDTSAVAASASGEATAVLPAQQESSTSARLLKGPARPADTAARARASK